MISVQMVNLFVMYYISVNFEKAAATNQETLKSLQELLASQHNNTMQAIHDVSVFNNTAFWLLGFSVVILTIVVGYNFYSTSLALQEITTLLAKQDVVAASNAIVLAKGNASNSTVVIEHIQKSTDILIKIVDRQNKVLLDFMREDAKISNDAIEALSNLANFL